MGQHTRFNLVYDGPALTAHTMDVRSLAPALLAMGDLLDRANEIFNGTQTKISVNVRASFKSGSFGIDMEVVQTLWQKVLEIAGSHPIAESIAIGKVIGLISGIGKGTMSLLKLIKWLRGRGIKKIEPIGDGLVKLYVDDEHAVVEDRVLKLLHDYKIRKSLEDLVSQPLRREGIDTVAIADDKVKEIVFEASKDEARFFIAPPVDEEKLETHEYTANLQVLNLAFADGNKWRFTEGGGNTYYATMLDENFMKAVATNREVFAKDDLIRAKVRRTQYVTADGLKADYDILEVLEHRSATPKVQLSLSLKTPPET